MNAMASDSRYPERSSRPRINPMKAKNLESPNKTTAKDERSSATKTRANTVSKLETNAKKPIVATKCSPIQQKTPSYKIKSKSPPAINLNSPTSRSSISMSTGGIATVNQRYTTKMPQAATSKKVANSPKESPTIRKDVADDSESDEYHLSDYESDLTDVERDWLNKSLKMTPKSKSKTENKNKIRERNESSSPSPSESSLFNIMSDSSNSSSGDESFTPEKMRDKIEKEYLEIMSFKHQTSIFDQVDLNKEKSPLSQKSTYTRAVVDPTALRKSRATLCKALEMPRIVQAPPLLEDMSTKDIKKSFTEKKELNMSKVKEAIIETELLLDKGTPGSPAKASHPRARVGPPRNRKSPEWENSKDGSGDRSKI